MVISVVKTILYTVLIHPTYGKAFYSQNTYLLAGVLFK